MLDLTSPKNLFNYLASTSFAASDVQTISGGLSGFTYRVILKNPERGRSVVVKHSLGYASSDKNLLLSPERMLFEYEALEAIARSGLFTPESTVQVPRVLFCDREACVLIMEDLAPARTLTSLLIEAFEAGEIKSVTERIGSALGDFMGRFHGWGARPEQGEMRKRFSDNTTSKDMILWKRYEWMIETAEKYGMKEEWMMDMVKEGMNDAQNGGHVIAMADFWTENILIKTEPELRIYIIDWEMARCARPEVDVADLAACVYSMAYIHPSASSSFRLMHSFMQSYKKHLTLDMVQIALNGGRYVMGFSANEPWTTRLDEGVKKDIVKCGLELLGAAREGNIEDIKKSVVVQDMYSHN